MKVNSEKVYKRFLANVEATQPETPSAFLELFALFAEALELEGEDSTSRARRDTVYSPGPLFPIDEDADTASLCKRCGASMHQDPIDKSWFCYGCERAGGE